VDDNLQEGDADDVDWLSQQMDDRFECKDTEHLTVDNDLDYLGMEISMDTEYTYLCMEQYILAALEVLGLNDAKPVSTPIDRPIDPDSPLLTRERIRMFMTACGMGTWLVITGRPDVAYAQSRIAQHMSAPTESAWMHAVHMFRYLKGTADLALAAPLFTNDIDLTIPNNGKSEYQGYWQLYTDTDHAGNAEVQNKRKSQNGTLATQQGAPVMWHSKVSSIAFAHPDIGEAHAGKSSEAAEIYGAANATDEMLHFSYIADEIRLKFPKPIPLQMDNTTAEAFANNSVNRSKLKHIDCRQEWVKMLRDKNILKPVHVDINDNLADIFTKILTPQDFIRLRNQMMMRRPRRVQSKEAI
jgi:hypothetical protein